MTVTDLNETFRVISDNSINETSKNFKKIQLNDNLKPKKNTFILNDTSFWDITFEQFDGDYIKYISTNAFGKSSSTIKSFRACRLHHSPPEYDVWKLLSGFVNAEEIEVGLNDSSKYYYIFQIVVPSQAFISFNGKQSNLNKIKLDFNYKKVGIDKKAFYNLENLNKLILHNGDFIQIESEAFAFRKKSTEKLQIVFSDSLLYDNTFQVRSFDALRRPVNIIFDNLKIHRNISYLHESVFKSVFDYDESSTITFHQTYINCTDCRNQWLLRDRKDRQVKDAYCIHSVNITLFNSLNRESMSKKCKQLKL